MVQFRSKEIVETLRKVVRNLRIFHKQSISILQVSIYNLKVLFEVIGKQQLGAQRSYLTPRFPDQICKDRVIPIKSQWG